MTVGIYDNYPYYGPYQQRPAQQAQTGMIWVQGEAGQKAYLVAPNTTVPLWDSEDKVIFLKSADASGRPSVRRLRYTIEDEQPAAAAPGAFVTRDELAGVSGKIDELRKRLDAMTEVHHE